VRSLFNSYFAVTIDIKFVHEVCNWLLANAAFAMTFTFLDFFVKNSVIKYFLCFIWRISFYVNIGHCFNRNDFKLGFFCLV
jgi:hypothetical protein